MIIGAVNSSAANSIVYGGRVIYGLCKVETNRTIHTTLHGVRHVRYVSSGIVNIHCVGYKTVGFKKYT